MNAGSGLFAAALLACALSACNTTSPTAGNATGPTSAGSAGPAYCETVPENPDDMEQWNNLCFPDR